MEKCRISTFFFLQMHCLVDFLREIYNSPTSGLLYVSDFFIKTVPRARIELATFRL